MNKFMPLWIIFSILSAVFAALVAILGKIGIASVDTTLATAVRAVVMALFLVFVSLALGKGGLLSTIGSKPLLFIILSGIAGALSWLFYPVRSRVPARKNEFFHSGGLLIG